jgi:hypothetical protein
VHWQRSISVDWNPWHCNRDIHVIVPVTQMIKDCSQLQEPSYQCCFILYCLFGIDGPVIELVDWSWTLEHFHQLKLFSHEYVVFFIGSYDHWRTDSVIACNFHCCPKISMVGVKMRHGLSWYSFSHKAVNEQMSWILCCESHCHCALLSLLPWLSVREMRVYGWSV